MLHISNSSISLALNLLTSCVAVAVTASTVGQAAEAVVRIDLDKPQAELSNVLYGLFFEDINYAADGGIYAELVQNRSFEYYPVEGWADNSRQLQPLFAWNKIERDGGRVALSVKSDSPLNENNTKYLVLDITNEGIVGVENIGFEGIDVEADQQYDFSVYARRSEGSDALRISLVDEANKEIASGTIPSLSSKWQKYELTLKPGAIAKTARLALTTGGTGQVMLDMVSLFPRETFKGRKNGMRPDLAQAIADLKPGFLRFPGGCIVHGHGMANAYRWKETVGDVAERKPNWNLWGYHQSYGLGYFEYMQLCEDIGATPLPVVPVGVPCGFRKPFDPVSMDDLTNWIDDALDLIEFANGPVDTKWGKLRAEMGHPKPFDLKYICLGNEENDTHEMRARFPYFVRAIREKYPDIKIVGTSGLGTGIPLYDLMTNTQVDSSDEHYYMQPDWYLNNVDRFDSFDRDKPKIFVGEYASEGNTQFNAVAEAAYLTGVERNADIVEMTCYAPLFARIGSTQWTKANLIWFTDRDVVKTPNYYVQQLFAVNKGDVYLRNSVEVTESDANKQRFAGKLGIGTWRTGIEVESAKLNGKSIELDGWQAIEGTFSVEDGRLTQRDTNIEAAVSVAPTRGDGERDVYEVRARKIGGAEGFLIVFACENDDSFYWWNVGGWGNTQHVIERCINGSSQGPLTASRGRVENDRWYDLRVELTPGQVRCFIDGKLVHNFLPQSADVFVSPTYSKSAGAVMVKLVNPTHKIVPATIEFAGGSVVSGEAELTTIAGPAKATNSVDSEAIHPVVSTLPATATMKLELPPMSVQVLRVGAE